ncbi:ureidoglycolate lyase [Salinisphaera orenii]|uniref:Ureidoglycolate hydrolase n=1 Tax=Salinisphaera orenii YIM 95161 TaxID=1051139 RepID=A0A423PMA2_9GAMM|nr:ureidoglycolate lyase [Salinisphaera halophila]ROO26736.1 ureidoglycolate hydrolase [Salinisphaera halophila YIM 95161]
MNSRAETHVIEAEPLTASAFAPYGDVIETAGHEAVPMNQGWARRYHDLADVDVTDRQGRVQISLAHVQAEESPVALRLLERHPLGSQIFMPLSGHPFLVVVAGGREAPPRDALRAFVGGYGQGVNYHKGIWHHPMIALEADADFLIVDRQGPGANCEEIPIPDGPVEIHRAVRP